MDIKWVLLQYTEGAKLHREAGPYFNNTRSVFVLF